MFQVIIDRQNPTVVAIVHGDNKEVVFTQECNDAEQAIVFANGVVRGLWASHQVTAAPLGYKLR